MKKFVFIIAVSLALLCNINVRSQSQRLIELSQKSMADAAEWLYDHFENFDRECFLAGTLDDSKGHYRTFTANKSIDEVDDSVKRMFEKDCRFTPDTMVCQRITAYSDAENVPLVLFIITLFKNDYPDLRALRVCSPNPPVRHYGREIKSVSLVPKDSLCRDDVIFELFSSSLAKTIASYYTFDYDNVSTVSSGGDIGYRGIINREKITTDAQKLSFLAGVLFRYKGFFENTDGRYTVRIPDSLSTAKACADFLKGFGCKVKEIPKEHKIVFRASDKMENLMYLLHGLFVKTLAGVVAF
jgi:hypothetical protein